MVKINRVHMNYENPLIGAEEMPQFGWEIESSKRDVVQKSYQLQISENEKFEELVYDSGVVWSEESAHIRPQDVKLQSARKYFVRVKIQDQVETSLWSEPAYFLTALLNETWRAPFVSADTEEADKQSSKGTYVRGCFEVKKPVREAIAFATGLGLYQFFLNGEKVGEDEMTPGWTSYRKHLLYQTYDVKNLLKEGTNVAGAMLGPGWYKGAMGLTKSRNNYGDQTGFAMQIHIRYEDGSEEDIFTDEHWKGCDSPVIFSEIYHGEIYDASLEKEDWCTAVSPKGEWKDTVFVPFDVRVIRAQNGARVKMIDKVEAKRIFVTPKGEQVIDFGQNMAGRIHVTAHGKSGDVIYLKCFEVLDADGNVYLDNLREARAEMKYTFGREETVTWHPRFTYMGFQYAQILSYPGSPKPEDFTAYTLHSEMEPKGALETSNPLLNQLHHNFLWGMKGNFLDVPTDCPQRDERLGWTGDAQIFCRTACYLMNTYTFYKKWLHDLEMDQTEDGGVPHVIPNIEEGHTEDNWLLSQSPHSAAAWADAAVIIPWTLYLMYGDQEILRIQYASMRSWIEFMREHSEDYIWNYKLQLGDWVALDAQEGSYFGATPNDLTCTAYFAYSTGLFAKIAKILGKSEAGDYEVLYQNIVKKFQNTFFDVEGNLTSQTQTAHIVALYFKLVPEEYVSKITERLKRLLEKENGHLVTGFVGTPYFCHALSQNGCVKEAYELLLKEDFPSWLYQVKMGATTIWEHWDGLKPDGTMWSADMNSFNHYAYGAIGEWMYRVMTGLEVDEAAPGFKHSIIEPQIGGGLEFVEGSYHSCYGVHRLKWQVDDDQVTVSVQIPANTTAEIRLSDVKELVQTDELQFRKEGTYMTASTGSGHYRIQYIM